MTLLACTLVYLYDHISFHLESLNLCNYREREREEREREITQASPPYRHVALIEDSAAQLSSLTDRCCKVGRQPSVKHGLISTSARINTTGIVTTGTDTCHG